MVRIAKILLASALGLVLVACNDSNNPVVNIEDGMDMGEIRVTHASPDAPKVNVYVNGEQTLSAVDFKQSSGNILLPEGIVEVEVRGIFPDGSEVSVIGPVEIDVMAYIRTDIVAWDNLFNNAEINIKAAVINNDISALTQVQASVLHVAPEVEDVDIYVTGPGDPLNSIIPIDANFGDFAGSLQLDADAEYRVRITPDGSDLVVYDSGTVSFSGGTEVVLMAVENTTGVGENPVNLLAVTESGATEIFDQNTGAEVRVVHNSADTPDIDVLIDGAEVLNAVPFPATSNYSDISAPAGTYNVVVAADADNTIQPIVADLTLDQATSYTVIAIGALNGIVDETLDPVVTIDQRRSIATELSLRVVHGSFAVAENIPVDVYLTESAEIIDADPVITGLAYGAATDQLPVTPGDYYVTVTAADDKTIVAFAAGPLSLEAGVNYTVIARDPSAAELGAPLILATILTD